MRPYPFALCSLLLSNHVVFKRLSNRTLHGIGDWAEFEFHRVHELSVTVAEELGSHKAEAGSQISTDYLDYPPGKKAPARHSLS